MGVWGATPEPKQYFLALCSPNTPFPGVQKHLCWPMGYRGMGVWGAIPEPKQYILALCISNTSILGIQKHLCWPMGYSGMGVWGATQEHKQFFGIVQSKQPHPRYPKTPLLAYGLQRYGCLGRHPQTQTIFLAWCISNTSILGIQKHFRWPKGYRGMGVWGATPKPKQFFWHCAFQKTPS